MSQAAAARPLMEARGARILFSARGEHQAAERAVLYASRPMPLG